jgi:hypothetical protein
MSNGNDGDWTEEKKKNGAVYKVLHYLAEHPEEGMACVGNDQRAQDLFEKIGQVSVPTGKGARVIFFATGERDLKIGSSVILEVPPKANKTFSDAELKKFVLGNYDYWPPT